MKKITSALLALALLSGLFAAAPLLAAAEAVMPEIISHPQSKITAPGQGTSFSVAASGEGKLSYQWFVKTADEEADWADVSNFSIDGIYSGANAARLVLSEVINADYDGYEYRCRISDEGGGFVYSESAKLDVKEPVALLHIASDPQNCTVVPGEPATFSVKAEGDGAFFYRWQCYVDMPGFRGWDDIQNTEIYSGLQSANMTVKNITMETFAHEGGEQRYRCAITGPGGTAYSNEATLKVVEVVPKPAVPGITQPESRSIKTGQNTTFGLVVTGAGMSYRWQALPNSDAPEWTSLIDSGIYSGANAEQLKLSNVPASYDGYSYRCAIYRFGFFMMYSDTVRLTITDAPAGESFSGFAPAVCGTKEMKLTLDYAPASTDAYAIIASPPAAIKKTSGSDAIIWNNATKKLEIAAGLGVGTYPVVLTAANGLSSATFEFVLTVVEAEEPQIETEETGEPEAENVGMHNFVAAKKYEPDTFSDIDENKWYGVEGTKAVALAYEYGLMTGYPDGSFAPEGQITLAEAVAMAARVHRIYFSGADNFVVGEPWHETYVNYATTYGIIEQGDFSDYSDYSKPATRAQMAYIFARSLPKEELAKINQIDALPDVEIDSSFGAEIFALYEACVLTGNDDSGTFIPDSPITRAEAAAIIGRIILTEARIQK